MTRSRLENTAKAPLPRSIDPGVPLEVETGPGSAFRANDLAARLRQEGAVREAVLMKEILDRPLSMRGGRR